ncbi:helix-turn-helix transcriptional regulator [Nocardia sp. NPDC050712]|uniref:helix-turn-helix transcriptional regulator n=1 Tax=Nocardia sp. NPDC050712 TaxID=3155518 RepID=UPI0033F75C4F
MTTLATHPARRTELTAFLRSRRARIRPGEVGITPGIRRRTPGLRREEVAMIAGVSVTWYTWLEQGREINASAQVLDAVARALRLDTAERAHLYELVGPGAGGEVGESTPTAETLAVLAALDPNPACVYNGKFDLLACNATYRALFPELAEATGAERNALWQLLGRDHEGGPFGNRHLLPRMVAILRVNYVRHLGEPDWAEFLDRLCAASGDFAALWADHQVAEPLPEITSFHRPPMGTIDMRPASFGVTDQPESRLMVYLPVGASDVGKLDAIRRDGLA